MGAAGLNHAAAPSGTPIRQQVAVSADGARHFGSPVTRRRVRDLTYAALAGGFGYRLGDSIGIAAAPDRAYAAWPLPNRYGNRPQHQRLWAGTVAER